MATIPDFRPEVDAYCDGVLSGEIVASQLVRCQVERHREDLQTARDRGLYFDEHAANRAIHFTQLQKLTRGEFDGKPFILQPWQKFIVWCLFGWKRSKDHMRRYREAFLTMGRGNGKSPFAAAIILLLFLYDDPVEPQAEIVVAATERAQAFKYVWTETRRMIDKQPALKSRVRMYSAEKCGPSTQMLYLPNGSTFEPLGKDAHSKDGMSLHGYIIDELHAFKDEHRELVEKLETSMAKRRQPLAIMITTAGSDRSLIWQEKHDYASKVARGVVSDDAFFPFIAELDPDDDPFDEANWGKANPNLDVSVKRDELRRMANKAQHNAKEKRKFLRYYMNIKVSSRLKAIRPELWAACGRPLPDLSDRLCHAGLDLGWRDDMAALATVFPLEIEDEEKQFYAVKLNAWIPEDTPRELTEPPWCDFIDQGVLEVTPGNITDVEAIYQTIEQLRSDYDLQTIALDPNNARAVSIHLVNVLDISTFEFFQTTRKYNEPTGELLSLLEEKRLIHGGNPLLAWAADNMVLREDVAGLFMPDKVKSQDKIDPMVALIMALSECLFGEQIGPNPLEEGQRSL